MCGAVFTLYTNFKNWVMVRKVKFAFFLDCCSVMLIILSSIRNSVREDMQEFRVEDTGEQVEMANDSLWQPLKRDLLKGNSMVLKPTSLFYY